jgi:hypothetical protein
LERALDKDDLADALGTLPDIPDPGELQQLLADAELALFASRDAVPAGLVRAGWYLHAVASQASDDTGWARRQRAFRISAHIFELALDTAESDKGALELVFGAELGYRRGGLDPNATAIFGRASGLLDRLEGEDQRWRETLALEAAVRLLSFRTREAFLWIRAQRAAFRALRQATGLPDLAGTMFGPAEHIVEAGQGVLRFLIFGDRDAFRSSRHRLERLLGEGAEPATTDERWVAAHLYAYSDALDANSVWTCLPPHVPVAARRALTATSPPVLSLWPPQRELLAERAEAQNLLDPDTKRAVLSIPTSAGKTLVAQILILSELASTGESVCLVAPQRSLIREIRRALLPRVRALHKHMAPDLPDFLADFAAELFEQAEPDVDVVTPERFAALLRADPSGVLERYSLFIFDEAHFVGDDGRGFTLEGALSYLHWRTLDTHHRIVLMSAAIGNDASFQAWLDADTPSVPFRSEWRGPRRLSAAYTTHVEWDQATNMPPTGKGRLYRVSYPVKGVISFTVPGAGARSYVTVDPVGELVFKSNAQWIRGQKDGTSTPHYAHVAGIARFLEHAGPVLTVTGTRPDAQRLASSLAADRAVVPDLARARDAIATVLGGEHPLVDLVQRGVAYHHAGLPLTVLALIEDELRAGALKHLVSTTTLTEGVNLPVHTVVLAETKWEGSDVHISGPRMLNAIGRAGRAGIETEGWVVFAPSGDSPRQPEQHLPDPDELQVRSLLATQRVLEHLEAFEARRADASDAVFTELPESLNSFTSFVWYAMSCEEALNNAVTDDELDRLLGTLYAARQVNADAMALLRRFAGDVRTTYLATDAAKRRAWARTGTRIRSAIDLEGLSARLSRAAATADDRGSVQGAIRLLIDTGALQEALRLPDIDENVWRFRTSVRGADVQVSLSDALRRWTDGQSISEMADDLLREIPDRVWRLEQLVDRISRGFGHAISWMVAVLLERSNATLTDLKLEPICPNLPLYVRFGVDSTVALRLVTRAVRSRDVAVRVARAVATGGVADDDVDAWLGGVPVDQWPAMFGAAPSDVLDLFDAIADTKANLLRRLLDGESAELQVGEIAAGEYPVELREQGGASVAFLRTEQQRPGPVLDARWQADLRTVLNTGISIYARSVSRDTVSLETRD